MLEPTEAQRKAGYCRKGQINIGDLDVTIETAMGAEKNSRFIFSYARKNEVQRRGLSILWDGQPLASVCRSLAGWSLLFRHNAVQSASWLARPEPFCLDFVMTQAEAWIHKRAPNANVRLAPNSGHKWLWCGTSAYDPQQTLRVFEFDS